METDFIVIGSGLAGLTSALVLSKYGQVVVMSKKNIDDAATSLAQGGIAAAVSKDDSFKEHIHDTFVAGSFHNKKQAVNRLVHEGPKAISWLVDQGVPFERTAQGFALGKEAAHSHNRILHATDFTGREIEKTLIKKVKDAPSITIWEESFAIDLLVGNKMCFGVQVIKDNKCINCFSRATILATGGLGQLYKYTTNPSVATGDGIAMAYRVGAKILDLEFIQFHPTALDTLESPLFLLSEAIRGEGAIIVDNEGKRFVFDYDKRGELAPRDVVSRAIFFQEQKGKKAFLDIRFKGKAFLLKRFPNIYSSLRQRGLDMAADLLPITPAAHYSCGGVVVDLAGRTSIKNLFAYGEVSCTGVHGANRLASNSLLEATVFPQKIVECLKELPLKSKSPIFPLIKFNSEGMQKDIRAKIQTIMWDDVGIVRKKVGLFRALKKLIKMEKEISGREGNKDSLEVKNMLTAARLITECALNRPKSLGAHYMDESGGIHPRLEVR